VTEYGAEQQLSPTGGGVGAWAVFIISGLRIDFGFSFVNILWAERNNFGLSRLNFFCFVLA